MATPKNKAKSKKRLVLEELFQHCQTRREYTFDNALVKEISENHGLKNPFDVTKVDNLSVLPENMRAQGYCVVHLGEGRHQFVPEAKHWFHKFEEIENEETRWKYRKSALNETDASESNILSVGFNQRIIHDFLYEDITANPKMYGSRRTKIDASYKLGNTTIHTKKLQLEIDMITEDQGVVTVFEGKNKFPENFSVYQLFHPFLYFHQLQQNKTIKIEKINCCYLLRDTEEGNSVVRLYLYTFQDANDISSIHLEKCEQYRLIKR